MNNIQSSLVYLDIELYNNKYNLDQNSFDNLNAFKLLEYLRLKHFHFSKSFNLKLSNLKILNLENCDKILLE